MKKYILFALTLLLSVNIFAQEKLTREQILNMTMDELSYLPLDELMQAVETLGVSSVDELFSLIMNKSLSSASKNEESSFTSPLSSTVITKSEMRTYGVSTIEEAFRLVPGMIITEKTNGVYDIQIRGLNNIPDNNMLLYTENSNTLVMIDGRPAHNFAMGAVNFEMLPISIEDVERIEVVRGASSALYGQNAVTGFINIITDKPNTSVNSVSGAFQMGNMNTYVGDIAIRKRINNKLALGVTANVQYRHRPTDKLYVLPGTGIYMAKDDGDATKSGMRYDQAGFGALIASGTLTDVTKGGYYSLAEVQRLKQIYQADGINYTIYDCTEPATPIASMFKNPYLARETKAFNGYASFTPNGDMNYDLTFGYQQSYINSTPVCDDYFSFNGRESKTGFANLNATIYGLRINAGFTSGPQTYSYGVPGFKVGTRAFNAAAEYDFKLSNLSILPGFFYQHIRYVDYKWEQNGTEMSGYFGYPSKNNGEVCDAELYSFAPSLRFNYALDKFRVMAAIRADKTNIPNDWNPSWQLAANYSFNDNNFVRFVYGYSNRTATFANTQTNYEWVRTNLVLPNLIRFEGNLDAKLMNSNSFELGYRWKPNQKLLIDLEAYYSFSKDFGALMSSAGNLTMSNDLLNYAVNALIQEFSKNLSLDDLVTAINAGKLDEIKNSMLQGNTLDALNSQLLPQIGSVGYIKYDNLPFKVHQFGVSTNVDWIISPKLIAKFNVNLQRTTIDNYYSYNQTGAMKTQLANCQDDMRSSIGDIIEGIITESVKLYMGGMDKDEAVAKAKETYIGNAMQYNDQKVIAELNSMTASEREAAAAKYKAEGNYGAYYAAAYGIYFEDGQYHIGNADYVEPEKKNGYVHRATPTLYGAFGLIYKPTTELTVSAFGNYLGKREYITKYGEGKLDDRFTVNMKVGYAPTKGFEIFFNAHNLFNSKAREFVFCDEMGLQYSFGVNFGF